MAGDCARTVLPAYEGEVEADAVYYNNLAYEPRPDDARPGGLVDQIMDEELTDHEFQELEAIRVPCADIIETTSRTGESLISQ